MVIFAAEYPLVIPCHEIQSAVIHQSSPVVKPSMESTSSPPERRNRWSDLQILSERSQVVAHGTSDGPTQPRLRDRLGIQNSLPALFESEVRPGAQGTQWRLSWPRPVSCTGTGWSLRKSVGITSGSWKNRMRETASGCFCFRGSPWQTKSCNGCQICVQHEIKNGWVALNCWF